MQNYQNRTISVEKKKLIEILKKHKENHAADYKQAVEDYKVEADKQIKKLRSKLKKGDMKLKFDLVSPVNKENEYEKIITMFEWEVEDIISLDQSEFNQYVHDEMPFASAAKLSNATYRNLRN